MPCFTTRILIVIPAVLIAMASNPVSAARFIKADATLDGEVVWSSSYTAGDRDPVSAVWRRLATSPFGNEVAFTPQPPDAGEHTLAGEIVLTVRHTDNVLAEAELERLELTLLPGGEWALTESEMQRTAAIAGIDLGKASPVQLATVLAVVVFTIILAIMGIILVAWWIRRQPADSQ